MPHLHDNVLGKRPGHVLLGWVMSPGEKDRESVKDGSVDLNRPETAGPNRVYRGGNKF